MNSKRVGNVAEAKLLSLFVEVGWTVLLPFGDNEPYDLVIDRGSGFERIQVKSARRRGGCLEFNAYSQPGRSESRLTTDYRGKADLFGVYFPENDKCYLVPVDEVGTTKVALRVDAPKKSDSTCRFASGYEVR